MYLPPNHTFISSSANDEACVFEVKTASSFWFCDRLSPSARRAMPVLSTLSPEFDKENKKLQEHTVTSVVRDAAMLLMATPLLVDGMIAKNGMDRKGSWVRIAT